MMNEESAAAKPVAKQSAAIHATTLKTLHYQYAAQPAEIEYWTDDFTSCYPGKDIPALGSLYIRYVPSAHLLELDSLKLYLLQYSDVAMMHENIVTRVLDDLVKACRPVSMTVEGDFALRAGLGIRAKAHYQKSRR